MLITSTRYQAFAILLNFWRYSFVFTLINFAFVLKSHMDTANIRVNFEYEFNCINFFIFSNVPLTQRKHIHH